MSSDLASSHPFVATYLKYIANTETPRLFHIWAGLSGVSACMGRRCYFDVPTGKIFPNLFIAIVGPPAVRKSTALKLMQKQLRENTSVRFAPDDTGGQRQGIIAAMNAVDEDAVDQLAQALTEPETNGHDSLAGLAKMNSKLEALASIKLDTRDPRTMYVCQPELKAFLGENNTQMTTFLCKMYDGDPYDYRLKSSAHVLDDALLGMLGCTTPSEISLSLPAEAIGGGFTSRIVFVFADRVHKKIPRPTLDETAGRVIGEIYQYVFDHMQGPFIESPKAAQKFDEIYMRGIVLKDPRFVNYVDRRDTHLKKLTMALTASRKSMTIELDDVIAADQLLLLTEENMSEALGEYGMSPLSAAKQKLLEYLKASTAPIPVEALWGVMAKDMKRIDFENTVNELHNTGKLKKQTINEIGNCLIATSQSGAKKAREGLKALADLLMVE